MWLFILGALAALLLFFIGTKLYESYDYERIKKSDLELSCHECEATFGDEDYKFCPFCGEKLTRYNQECESHVHNN